MLIALAACILLGCTTQGVAAASLRGSQSRDLDALPATKKAKPPAISTDFTTVQAFRWDQYSANISAGSCFALRCDCTERQLEHRADVMHHTLLFALQAAVSARRVRS
jgi:hypothetical protein